MSHSRMMSEHFGISILESDAKLLHERIQLLITEAYNRGVQHERYSCAMECDKVASDYNPHRGFSALGAQDCAKAIRARGKQ